MDSLQYAGKIDLQHAGTLTASSTSTLLLCAFSCGSPWSPPVIYCEYERQANDVLLRQDPASRNRSCNTLKEMGLRCRSGSCCNRTCSTHGDCAQGGAGATGKDLVWKLH